MAAIAKHLGDLEQLLGGLLGAHVGVEQHRKHHADQNDEDAGEVAHTHEHDEHRVQRNPWHG